MQTRTYLAALARIKSLLRVQELLELLNMVFDMDGGDGISKRLKDDFANLLFGLDSALTQLNADPQAAPVVSLLNLDVLLDRALRAEYMTMFHFASQAHQIIQNLMFSRLRMALALLVSLIENSKTLLNRDEGELVDSDGMSVLAIEVEDFTGSGIEPERLASVLNAFSECYKAVQDSAGATHGLVLRWTDSGSNVVFGFEGLASILEVIRGMFGDVFQTLRFWRHSRDDRAIESATKQLRFLQEVKAGALSGALTQEGAELIQRRVTASMHALISAGAMPVSIEQNTYATQREVLEAVGPQLLLPPGSDNQGFGES